MRVIHRDIVGAFIFSSDNKLLLGKTGAYEGYLVVPGGGIDEGETKLEALRREILEETGIDINSGNVEAIYGGFTGESEKNLRDTGERVLVKMTFYNFKVSLPLPAANIKVAAADDFIDAKWYDTDNLKTLKLSPPTVTTLKKLGYLK